MTAIAKTLVFLFFCVTAVVGVYQYLGSYLVSVSLLCVLQNNGLLLNRSSKLSTTL